MKKMNFDGYSLSELHDLQNDITQEIAGRQEKQERNNQARQKVLETLQEVGITLPEFMEIVESAPRGGKKPGSKRSPVPPKYRNPNDATQTWTGRGRKPKWVEAYLNTGGSMQQIEI